MQTTLRSSLISLLICGPFFLAGCGKQARSEPVKTEPKAQVVAAAIVSRQTLDQKEVLSAEFRPFQVIDVHAKVAGYLKKIYVDVGDRVTEGQTLALLEVPELEDDLVRSQAAKSRSSSEVNRAAEELARTESQHNAVHVVYQRLLAVSKAKPGLIAQQELDDAFARDQSSEAAISAAKATLGSMKESVNVAQADIEKVKTMTAYTKITAPFTGVVTKRYADTGAMVPAGTSSANNGLPIVQLSQNNLLRLVLPVPEAIVNRIRLGQPVTVHVNSLKRDFPGTVKRFSDMVAMSTRTMNTEIDVPNGQLLLIPGMYAEATITLEHKDNALSVPLEALTITGNTATAYVVGPDQKISIRKVSIGLEAADRIEIVSGLKEGDVVITGNRGGLAEGAIVTAKIADNTTKAADRKKGGE